MKNNFLNFAEFERKTTTTKCWTITTQKREKQTFIRAAKFIMVMFPKDER